MFRAPQNHQQEETSLCQRNTTWPVSDSATRQDRTGTERPEFSELLAAIGGSPVCAARSQSCSPDKPLQVQAGSIPAATHAWALAGAHLLLHTNTHTHAGTCRRLVFWHCRALGKGEVTLHHAQDCDEMGISAFWDQSAAGRKGSAHPPGLFQGNPQRHPNPPSAASTHLTSAWVIPSPAPGSGGTGCLSLSVHTGISMNPPEQIKKGQMLWEHLETCIPLGTTLRFQNEALKYWDTPRLQALCLIL